MPDLGPYNKCVTIETENYACSNFSDERHLNYFNFICWVWFLYIKTLIYCFFYWKNKKKIAIIIVVKRRMSVSFGNILSRKKNSSPRCKGIILVLLCLLKKCFIPLMRTYTEVKKNFLWYFNFCMFLETNTIDKNRFENKKVEAEAKKVC